MPIKPPNQRDRNMDMNGWYGRQERDYTVYNKDPQTYKTDREPTKKRTKK
jgi:hypothetical protein